jgi:DNA invertase Pin-like site-specific DNA recombinase
MLLIARQLLFQEFAAMSTTNEFQGPKSGKRYLVLAMSRISTDNQKATALDDQNHSYRVKLDRELGPDVYDMEMCSYRGSGQYIDSKEYLAAIDLIDTGKFDFVVCEDLSRIVRRAAVIMFIEQCLDKGTHVLSFNDGVDTRRKGWLQGAYLAAMRHDLYIQDTVERVTRTAESQFDRGGAFACPIFGYIKPPGAKKETDIQKDPQAQPIYDLIFTMLEQGASFSAVADKLNEMNVPVGPSVRRTKRWTCALLGNTVRNPLLKGDRRGQVTKSVRGHVLRRAKRIKTAEKDIKHRLVPQLAFIEPERYDQVLAMLKTRNKRYSRNRNGHDPLLNRPKKRTVWPGQHCYCSICNRVFVYGKSNNLLLLDCSGAREYKCWQGFQVNPELARKLILDAIYQEIASLPDFELALRENLQAEVRTALEDNTQRRQAISRQLASKQTAINNLLDFVEQGKASEKLQERLKIYESEESALKQELRELENRKPVVPSLPAMDELRKLFRAKLHEFAAESQEFALILKRLIPRIEMHPMQICDKIRGYFCRAKFQLNLFQLTPGLALVPALAQHLTRSIEVDIFEPPQRVRHLQQVLDMRAQGLTEVKVAELLKLNRTVVQHMARLKRTMDAKGLSEPYEYLLEPPVGRSKLKSHLHPRYRFEPLPPPNAKPESDSHAA